MTPLQLIKEECANYEHDGSCAGITFGDDLQVTAMRPLPRCCVLEGKPCSYFDDCIAPMAGMSEAYADAVAEYRQATNQKSLSLRLCECGTPLLPRKRFCPKCASKRRKAAYRASWNNRQSETPQLTGKTA